MSVLAFPSAVPVPAGPRRGRSRRHLSLVPDLPAAPRPLAPSAGLSRPGGVEAVRGAQSKRGEVADVPMRLTARGRGVLAGLAIVLAAAVGSVAGVVASAAQAPSDVEVVTVSSGDTLWEIAAQIAPAGVDVRDVMAEITALNDLEGGLLLAGQELTIPSYSAG